MCNDCIDEADCCQDERMGSPPRVWNLEEPGEVNHDDGDSRRTNSRSARSERLLDWRTELIKTEKRLIKILIDVSLTVSFLGFLVGDHGKAHVQRSAILDYQIPRNKTLVKNLRRCSETFANFGRAAGAI